MDDNHDNWIRMQFKGNKVWVSLDPQGRILEKNGKVLVKYQLDQDYEYWVNRKKIKPLDESTSQESSPHLPEKKISLQPDAGDRQECSNAICIYTDGASSGNPGPAGIGILMRYGAHEKRISRYIGTATNNVAELEAIRTGLAEVKNRSLPVRIFTDSGYAYGLIVLGWQAKKNQVLVKSINELQKTFKDLKFIKVRGHAGHPGNEMADQLATSVIKRAMGQLDGE